jgi:acetate kinase
VLSVNAGSTSLKLDLVDDDETSSRVEGLAVVDAGRVVAVGHRVVHGGARFREPVLVDESVKQAIAELTPLAPLHNAPALQAIEEAQDALPQVPHVAVFDTAFHATIPEEAATYALPALWREWGVRRYGFHGISVQWAAERLAAHRLVVCHLGGGSSITAVSNGRSIDTTMGFSPLEGVPMTTRSGSVDPGALLYVLREHGLSPADVDDVLEHRSGLAALSGGSGDVQDLLVAEAVGDERARLALAVYVHHVAAAIAAMAAALGGLDALVFTAGIGEHAAAVRERVCARLGFLGVRLDARANAAAKPDADIGLIGSAVRVVVLAAREEVVVARAVRQVLSAGAR